MSLPVSVWTYSIPIHGRTIVVALPVEQLARGWAELVSIGDRHGVSPALMVAIALVETALADGTWRFFSPRVARRLLSNEPVGTLLDADFAVRYLATQLQRFDHRIALALAAYHTCPDWVSDTGGNVLGDACTSGYVRAVLSLLSDLCAARPWCAWRCCTAARARLGCVSNGGESHG